MSEKERLRVKVVPGIVLDVEVWSEVGLCPTIPNWYAQVWSGRAPGAAFEIAHTTRENVIRAVARLHLKELSSAIGAGALAPQIVPPLGSNQAVFDQEKNSHASVWWPTVTFSDDMDGFVASMLGPDRGEECPRSSIFYVTLRDGRHVRMTFEQIEPRPLTEQTAAALKYRLAELDEVIRQSQHFGALAPLLREYREVQDQLETLRQEYAQKPSVKTLLVDLARSPVRRSR